MIKYVTWYFTLERKLGDVNVMMLLSKFSSKNKQTKWTCYSKSMDDISLSLHAYGLHICMHVFMCAL